MARKPCRVCFGETHAPECPELFWPDGRRRGTPPDLPLPPFNPELKIAYPGGWQPIGEEFGKIFGGLMEAMIVNHIEETRKNRADS